MGLWIAANSALAPLRTTYIRADSFYLGHHMTTFLFILTGIAFACVLLTLVMGTVAMSKKSEENRKKSNKWMWRRIYAQVAAIVLLALTVYSKSKGA